MAGKVRDGAIVGADDSFGRRFAPTFCRRFILNGSGRRMPGALALPCRAPASRRGGANGLRCRSRRAAPRTAAVMYKMEERPARARRQDAGHEDGHTCAARRLGLRGGARPSATAPRKRRRRWRRGSTRFRACCCTTRRCGRTIRPRARRISASGRRGRGARWRTRCARSRAGSPRRGSRAACTSRSSATTGRACTGRCSPRRRSAACRCPMYQDAPAADFVFVLNDAEIAYAIVEDQEQVDKMLEAQAAGAHARARLLRRSARPAQLRRRDELRRGCRRSAASSTARIRAGTTRRSRRALPTTCR